MDKIGWIFVRWIGVVAAAVLNPFGVTVSWQRDTVRTGDRDGWATYRVAAGSLRLAMTLRSAR